jgi:hypothetical protein
MGSRVGLASSETTSTLVQMRRLPDLSARPAEDQRLQGHVDGRLAKGRSLGGCLASKPRFYTRRRSMRPPPLYMTVLLGCLIHKARQSSRPVSAGARRRIGTALSLIATGRGCATTGSRRVSSLDGEEFALNLCRRAGSRHGWR